MINHNSGEKFIICEWTEKVTLYIQKMLQKLLLLKHMNRSITFEFILFAEIGTFEKPIELRMNNTLDKRNKLYAKYRIFGFINFEVWKITILN